MYSLNFLKSLGRYGFPKNQSILFVERELLKGNTTGRMIRELAKLVVKSI